MHKIYKDDGFYYAEEVYSYNPAMMKIIANMMAKDKIINKQEYLSFCSRHPDIVIEDPKIAM